MRLNYISVVLPLLAVLAACGEDKGLKAELAEMTKDMRPSVPPLPQVKPYDPFPYVASDLPDPFRPSSPKLFTGAAGKFDKEISRSKEALEVFPLESLRLVGVMSRLGDPVTALIKSEAGLSRVTVGRHLGQNYGLVTAISPDTVELRELYQDATGNWVEKKAVLNIEETEAKR